MEFQHLSAVTQPTASWARRIDVPVVSIKLSDDGGCYEKNILLEKLATGARSSRQQA